MTKPLEPWPLPPPIMTEPLEPWQRRLVEEADDVMNRTKKLEAFIHGEIFDTLPEDEKGRLLIQINLMLALTIVLAQRMKAFGVEV